MPTEPTEQTVSNDEPLASLDAAMDAWDTPEDDEEAQEASDEQQAGPDEEAPAEDDFDLTDGDAEAEPQDGPDEYKNGQFAADTARVKLEDGSTVTIAELKRGSMRDGDYTRGKMALAEKERTWEQKLQSTAQLDTELQEQRNIIMALAEQMAPKRPDPSLIDTDLASFTLQERAYQAFQDSIKQLGAQMEGHRGRQTKEMQEKRQGYLQSERSRLEEIEPRFKDEKWRASFFKAAEDAGAAYGYTPQEFYQLSDHRHFLIMRDALAWRRSRQALAKQGNGQQKGKTLTAQRRPGNANGQAQQTAKARFQRNPTLRNAVDLLPD